MKLQAPIEIDLFIFITNGESTGKVTIGMTKGAYCTEQALRERVAKFEKEEMPEGFRLETKREWFDRTVGKVFDGADDDGKPVYLSAAMPGGRDWDD